MKVATCIGAAVILAFMSFAVPVDANDPQVSTMRAAYHAARKNFGGALAAQGHGVRAAYHAVRGNFGGALAEMDQVIESLDPSYPLIHVAYFFRGKAKQSTGDLQGAAADFDVVIQKDANDPVPYNELAWLLATAKQPSVRDGRRALEAALKACELSQWKNAAFIDTLAAAYARSGDFAKAVEWQEKAADRSGEEGAVERLQLYRAGKAYPPD